MLVDQIFSELSHISNDLLSEQQLNIIKQYSKKAGVAVWGTGRAGKYAVDFCKKNNITPICVVDSFEHEKGSVFEGIPLYSEKDFYAYYSGALVLIACSYGYYIDRKLEQHSIPYLMFDTNLYDQLINAISYQELLQRDRKEIESVYTFLTDNTSKQTFERILKYRLTFDRNYIDGLNTQNIYFDNDVVPTFTGNTFVDCGAYIGDTLLSFYQSKTCCCKKYYALEPSFESYERLKSVIEANHFTSAAAVQVGAWDQTDTLRFANTQGAGSCISANGEIEVPVDSLDHLFYGENVDFIKMDIEGAETEAITGAKHIIQSNRPILAFSIYHKMDDLWKLPLLIKNICSGYRLYIRHHSPWGDDTVCYAVYR